MRNNHFLFKNLKKLKLLLQLKPVMKIHLQFCVLHSLTTQIDHNNKKQSIIKAALEIHETEFTEKIERKMKKKTSPCRKIR